MINLKQFPKVELHIHLDGSVKIETALELLNKTKEELQSEMIAKDKCLDLNEYLTKFKIPISIMQTKEQLIRIAGEVADDLYNDGVIYAEIRFAPINHITILTLEEVVESVLEGFKNSKLKSNLILCLMRHSSFEDNKKIIELAHKYLNKGVCAVDLAGAEGLYKTESFKELFDIVKQENIPFTIHAGEADGIDSIKSAIDFGTKRIGHGIRCIENNETINLIKEKNITLEICPTSNVQTNVVNEYINHPIKYLYNNNVKVTLNTDNRTVSNISLTDEYEKLIKTFNFSLEDIKKMNMYAIESSFLSQIEKELLKIEYEGIYEGLTNNN